MVLNVIVLSYKGDNGDEENRIKREKMKLTKYVFCTSCHWYGDRPREKTPGLFIFELVFWGLFVLVVFVVNPLDGLYVWDAYLLIGFIIPPLSYSGWRLSSGFLACPVCGHDTLIPSDSPRARVMIDRYNKVQLHLKQERMEDFSFDDSR